MDVQNKILSFASLYEAAGLLDPADSYEKQNELADYCRASGRPFLYKMLVRHLFRCKACGIQTAEAHLHFEVPPRPAEGVAPAADPRHPSGYSFDIELSALHDILVHGKEMPERLQEFFSRVGD